MEFQAVLEAVRALPLNEQIRLAGQIDDDMQALAKTFPLTPEQMQEIERRLAAYDANPSIGIPWEDVETAMDKQLEELGE